jgi:hypothetical protein
MKRPRSGTAKECFPSVGFLQIGDHPEQLSLAVRDLRPPAGKEVRVQLPLDRLHGDRRGWKVLANLLYEDVEDLSTAWSR